MPKRNHFKNEDYFSSDEEENHKIQKLEKDTNAHCSSETVGALNKKLKQDDIEKGLESTIFEAVLEGSLGTLQTFIREGVDLNLRDQTGWTPLHYAVFFSTLEVVEFLLTREANPNLHNNDHWTPLHIAVAYSDLEIVQALVVGGANLNLQRDDGWSALHVAVFFGRFDVVGYLIEQLKARQMSIDIQDRFGDTPIVFAFEQKSYDILDLLQQHGAALPACTQPSGVKDEQDSFAVQVEGLLQLRFPSIILSGLNIDSSKSTKSQTSLSIENLERDNKQQLDFRKKTP